MICVGEGRYRVALQYIHVGRDILVIITGGEEAHIGAASLIEDGAYLQTIKKGGHKDYIVSEKMAKAIYDRMERDLLIVCGIHIEDAAEEEIKRLIDNAEKCVDEFLTIQEKQNEKE